VGLAHDLGLSVVAEGVEDQDTWDPLLEVGCDVAQGYFISRPLPPLVLGEWLTRRIGSRSTHVSPEISLKPADQPADSEADMHLLQRDRPATSVSMRRLAFTTSEAIQLVDVTDDIAAAVRNTGVRDGIVTIVSRHTTMATRIQEAEPLLMEDLLNFLRRLAPSNVHYQHNDFRIRTHHMHDDESPNGHSHCLQFLLATSETVPVVDGELALGEWQRIFLVELDGPRPKREVLIQTVGVPADEAA
jgi:secondary thiamine-phosphate synthase enzyme